MFEFLRNAGAFIIALGILVAVHEWGHYYVARLCGVYVKRFSIGFGGAENSGELNLSCMESPSNGFP